MGDGRLTEQDAARLQRAAERASQRLGAHKAAVLARTATVSRPVRLWRPDHAGADPRLVPAVPARAVERRVGRRTSIW